MPDIESRLRALEEKAEGTGFAPHHHRIDGRLPVRSISTAANVTITRRDLNSIWVIENTAAIDFTLPTVEPGEWIIVVNDSTSTNDVTVKDSGGGTVSTVTPGNSSGHLIGDRNNSPAPPL